MKKAIALIAGIAMMVCLAGCSAKDKETGAVDSAAEAQEITTEEAATDTTAEEPDSVSTTEEEKSAALDTVSPTDVYAYYQEQIDEIVRLNTDGANQETAQFCLYDLDGDGIPELFLNCGYKTNAYEKGILVFSYSIGKGGWEAGTINSAAQAFYDKQPGDGEINVLCVHHGTMAEFSYRIDGEQLTETTVADWHTRTDEEFNEDVNAVKDLLVMDGEWTPLTEAGSYFAGLPGE